MGESANAPVGAAKMHLRSPKRPQPASIEEVVACPDGNNGDRNREQDNADDHGPDLALGWIGPHILLGMDGLRVPANARDTRRGLAQLDGRTTKGGALDHWAPLYAAGVTLGLATKGERRGLTAHRK